MPTFRPQFVLLAILLLASGCTTLVHQGKSPLLPAQMSPDSVALDLFFVRFPFGDSEVNEKLWDEIDEQQFAPELRRLLARNGFRAGLISGQMPMALSKLLELSDKPPPSTEMEGAKVDELDTQPRVMRQHLQLRAGLRSEIIASGIYPELPVLPVLMSESRQISGQTYYDAQGLFALKSYPQPDGTVRLQLVPELHHDQPRQRWVGGQGMMRLETSRPKRAFDDLTLSANLAPGSMLVISSLRDRPGSLGHYFFTEDDGKLQQKLLIVRLTQTQPDALFRPTEPTKRE